MILSVINRFLFYMMELSGPLFRLVHQWEKRILGHWLVKRILGVLGQANTQAYRGEFVYRSAEVYRAPKALILFVVQSSRREEVSLCGFKSFLDTIFALSTSATIRETIRSEEPFRTRRVYRRAIADRRDVMRLPQRYWPHTPSPNPLHSSQVRRPKPSAI